MTRSGFGALPSVDVDKLNYLLFKKLPEIYVRMASFASAQQ
jgi:hypothetical protein